MLIPLFDAHCDTLTQRRGLRHNRGQLDLYRLAAFRPAAQVFSIWADKPWNRPVYCDFQLRRAHKLLAENADLAVLCTSAADAKRAAEAGKIAAFLSVEGAELLGCSAATLHRAYNAGVRLVNITWNHDNALAGAAMDGGGGLTDRGRSFVRGCQTLGVAVDVSHLSEAAFWDVIRIAQKPVLASHSNAKGLCDHPRNLTDAQFMAIMQVGGVVGLNLCPDFLGQSRSAEAVADHAEYFLRLGGRHALCLGADLDGIPQMPVGMRGVENMRLVYEAMRRRGWSDELLADIFYHNLMRFMEATL